MKLYKILKSTRGNSCLHTAIIVLVIVLLFSVVLTYASIMTTVSTVEDNTQQVLDSFIMHNAKEIYASIKNGNDYIPEIDKEFFVNNFDHELSLEISGDLLYSKNKENNVIFYLTNPLTTNLKDNTLRLQTSFDLHVPVSFANRKLFDVGIPLKVKSSYALRY